MSVSQEVYSVGVSLEDRIEHLEGALKDILVGCEVALQPEFALTGVVRQYVQEIKRVAQGGLA
jgi:hypothetical protein